MDIRFGALQGHLYKVTVQSKDGSKLIRYFATADIRKIRESEASEAEIYGGTLLSIENVRGINILA